MCQRVQCVQCGKPTFAGCGRHVEAVLGDVPVEKRCHCREDGASKKDGKSSSVFDWLFSKG